MAAESANCRMFSGCWGKAVRRVCGAYQECCPSDESYKSCAEDPSSRLCKKTVCPESATNVAAVDSVVAEMMLKGTDSTFIKGRTER